jgi:hypothetical protein
VPDRNLDGRRSFVPVPVQAKIVDTGSDSGAKRNPDADRLTNRNASCDPDSNTNTNTNQPTAYAHSPG